MGELHKADGYFGEMHNDLELDDGTVIEPGKEIRGVKAITEEYLRLSPEEKKSFIRGHRGYRRRTGCNRIFKKNKQRRKMKINIRAIHFDLTEDLRDHAADKIGNLDNYYKNIVMADIAVENHESEAKDKYHYIAKVKLAVPGKDIFAEGTGPDEFACIDNVEQKLRVQIEKLKNKQNRGRFDDVTDMFKNFFGK